MKSRLIFIVLALAVSNALGRDSLRYVPQSHIDYSQEVVMFSSGTTYAFVEGCIRALTDFHPGFDRSIVRQFTSSNGAFEALSKNETKICTVSYRMPVRDHEAFTQKNDHPLLYSRILTDAVCVGVHPDNPLNEISIAQLDAIFGSTLKAGWGQRITTWDDLGLAEVDLGNMDISVHGGSEGWGTVEFFRARVLQGGSFAPGMVAGDIATGLEDTSSVEYRILNDPTKSGIGFMSYRPREVKLLKIKETSKSDGFEPIALNIYTDTYPYLTRNLYVYMDYDSIEDAPPQIVAFVSFMLSVEGQTIAAELGYLPMTTEELITARRRLGIADEQ